MESFLKKNKWLLFIYGIFSLAAYIVLTTMFMAYSWITDAAMEKDFARGQLISLQVALMMAGLLVFLYLLFFIERYTLYAISKSLRETVVKKIFNLNYKGFYEEENSYYISMIVNDIDILENDYYASQINIIGEIVRILVTFVFIGMIGIKYVFIVLILMLPSILQPFILRRKISRAGLKNSVAMTKYNDKTNEYIYGMEEVITSNNLNLFKEKFKEDAESLEKTRYKSQVLGAIDSALAQIGVYILKLIGPIIYINNAIMGLIKVPVASSLFVYTDNIAGPIVSSLATYKKINSTKNIKKKIDDFLLEDRNIEPQLEDIDDIKEIRISDLDFSYGETRILKDINFNFKAGHKYAIFGASGSGKSTLIKLIMGLDKSYEGQIFFNEKELKEISNSSLWDQVAYIQQKVFVMGGSLRDNISMFSDAYINEEIEEVIEIAGLKEIIESLPEGIDSLIKEGGTGFSGGEKQRISIARALLANKSILLLDESFSALDSKNSLEIEKKILDLNKTIISISHRPNDNLYTYDEILVLKDGKIIESGTYEELKKEGTYFCGLITHGKEVEKDEKQYSL